MIDKETEKILFIEIHKTIEQAALYVIKLLEDENQELRVSYPYTFTLSAEEQAAIRNLTLSDPLRSALKKIILDAASYPLFQLFTLMDGVGDPEIGNFDIWHGVSFCSKQHDVMLHDAFYDYYEEYMKVREQLGDLFPPEDEF